MRKARAGTPALFTDVTRRPDLPWTDEQRAVYDRLAASMAQRAAGRPPRHIAVDSVAGSSKTTVLNECLHRLPAGTRALVLAYNRSTREALEPRVPERVRVETLHSYGFKILSSVWGPVAPSPRRDREVLAAFLPPGVPAQGRALARRLYGLARADGASSEADVLATLAARRAWLRPRRAHQDAPEPLPLPPGLGNADLARWVAGALAAARVASQSISFDEMCSLPVKLGLGHAEYDFVAVDEFQDLSPVQIDLALGAVAPGGVLMGVGDPMQSIYGFRGASPRAMEVFVARTGAQTLGMSVSMRCSEAVAEVARELVPAFRSRPGAPAGSVSARGWRESVEAIRAAPPSASMVLSRTNAPLVAACLDLWRAGVRARILGRDLAKDVGRLVAQAEREARPGGADPQPIPARELVAWLRRYVAADAERYDEEDVADGAGSELRDTAESLEALAEGARDTAEVRGRVDALFSDKGAQSAAVLLATAHAAKGLERHAVYVLPTFGGAEDEPELAAERRRLFYVAVTRCALDLTHVTGLPGR